MMPPEQREELLKSGALLKKQQKTFLQEFVRTNKILTAMRNAGYKGSPSYLISLGYKMLKDPDIQPYLKSLEEEEALHRSVTREYLIVKLKEIVEDKSIKAHDKIDAINTLARVSNIIRDGAPENGRVVFFQAIGLEEQQQPKEIQVIESPAPLSI